MKGWLGPLAAGLGVGALALYYGAIDAGVQEARDLAVYLASSRVWLDGGNPLRCVELRPYAETSLSGCFVSPAWTLVATAPLGPLATVTTPWRVAGALLMALAAATWVASLPVGRRVWGAVGATALAAGMSHTLSMILGGNLEPVVAAALGGAALAVSRGRTGLAGALVGLAGAVKVVPWALVAGLRRPGWSRVAAAVALVVLTDALILHDLLPGVLAGARGDSDATQPTLLGLLRSLRGSKARVDPLEIGAWAFLTLLALGLTARALRGASPDRVFQTAALTLFVCLPRGWDYVWLGAIGPVAACWATTPASAVGIVGLALGATPARMFAPWAVAALTWAVVVGRALRGSVEEHAVPVEDGVQARA